MKQKIIKLKNGGILIYEKSSLNNATAVEVGFKIGSFNEKVKGSAHFLEHMLFKKTKNRDNEKLENDRSEIAFLNATTGADYVLITFYRSNRLILQAVNFAEDVLVNSLLDDEFMQSERKVIINELEICKDAEKRDIYVKNLRQAQSNTIFSSDIVGETEKNINKITFQDLANFKNEYFNGNNFVISVVSKLKFSKIRQMVKIFEKNIKFDPNFVAKSSHYDNSLIDKPSSLKIINNDQEKVTTLISLKINYGELDLINNLNYSFLSKFFSGLQGDLFLKLRNRGLIYNLHSEYVCLKNNSLLNISFDSFGEKIQEIVDIFSKTIQNIIDNGIEQNYIDSFKRNLDLFNDEKMPKRITTIVHDNLMDIIYYGKIINQTKTQKKKMLNNVNNGEIVKILKEIFNRNNKIFVSIMGNIEKCDLLGLNYFKDKFLITKE